MVLFDTRLFRRIFQSKSASLYIDKIVNLLIKQREESVNADIDDEIRGNAGTYFERIGTYDGLSSIYKVPKTGTTIDYWVSEYPDKDLVKLWLYFDHVLYNYSGGIGYVRDMSYFDRHAKMLDNYCMANGGSGLVLPWRPDSVPSIVTIPNGVNQPYSVPDTADLQVGSTDFSLVGVIYPKSFAESELTRNLNCIRFDGNNDYIDAGNHASLWSQSLTKFSFSFWAYFEIDGVTNFKDCVNHSGGSALGFRCYLGDATNRIKFRIRDAANSSHDAFFDMSNLKQWHFVVCVYDNSLGSDNVKIYVDGVIGTSTNLTEAINKSANLALGNGSGEIPNTIQGTMKDFRWWTTVPLTQTDVTNLLNGREDLVTRPDYHLPMNEGTGNPRDSIGESLTGTLTNGAAWVKEKFPGVSFDGSNDYLDLGKRLDLWNKKLDKFSFSFWAYFNGINDIAFRTIIGLSPNSSNELAVFFADGTPNTLLVQLTSDDYVSFAEAQGTINTLGRWYFIVVTYDKSLSSNRLKVYIDSVIGTTTSNVAVTLNNKADNLYLGMFNPGDSPFGHKGHLSDFRWWNDKAQTQSQINDLFNGIDDPDNKPSYWLPLNEGTGNPVDLISKNIRGTPLRGILNGAFWRTDIYSTIKSKVKSICSKADSGTDKYLLYFDETGGGRVRMQIRKGGTEIIKETSSLLSLNTWSWIVVTFKQSTNTIKIYINGTDVTQSATWLVEYNKNVVTKDLFIISKNASEGFLNCGIYLFGFVRSELSSTLISNFNSNKATFSDLTGAQVAWIDYCIPQ